MQLSKMMAKSLKKRKERLAKELEALPHSELPSEKALQKNFYPFSNERGIDSLINTLKTTRQQPLERRTIRVAILIGQSSFCSLLPFLTKYTNMIVFADINPLLIMHTKRILALLKSAPNRYYFEQEYKEIENELLQHFEYSQVRPSLTMRKKDLGESHFLFNNENFIRAQQAALKIHFAFSHVNLFHPKDCAKFFACFYKREKCVITLFNATNLYEWDAPIPLPKIKSIEQWCPSGKLKRIFSYMEQYSPLIMHSVRISHVETCSLKMQLCSSFSEYWKINNLAAETFLKNALGNAYLSPIAPPYSPIRMPNSFESATPAHNLNFSFKPSSLYTEECIKKFLPLQDIKNFSPLYNDRKNTPIKFLTKTENITQPESTQNRKGIAPD